VESGALDIFFHDDNFQHMTLAVAGTQGDDGRMIGIYWRFLYSWRGDNWVFTEFIIRPRYFGKCPTMQKDVIERDWTYRLYAGTAGKNVKRDWVLEGISCPFGRNILAEMSLSTVYRTTNA
jgi:hypothetical protein